MPSTKPQSKVYLTASQFEAEKRAIKKSGLSVSEFRRMALRRMIEEYKIKWPDDMPSHGGKRKEDAE